MMEPDLWAYEKKAANDGFLCIAGVDEAGRGPLAGPVVSAAVILPADCKIEGIQDSKKVAPRKRALLYERIYEHAVAVGIGIVDSVEIDRINILQAALLSMAISVKNLTPQPDCLLIDGQFQIESDLPQQAIIKGDAQSISIAAASIVAKVTRDRLMEKYDEKYPHFGFARHKGYPTRMHKEAIREFGPSPIHRQSFKGVKEYVQPSSAIRRGS